ncbi:MAG: M28 family peptidase [Planctomycetota bacterium]|nr:MAG: M28 family peptidase [Planctomycetota bacterium]
MPGTKQLHHLQDELLGYLRELTRTPRPPQSPELELARRYVERLMSGWGWRVERDAFEADDERGTRWRGINLLAEHPSWDASTAPVFCVGAHLDSVPDSPGADDNASAVATLLSVARRLAESAPRQTILKPQLVFFDLEECGMLGGAAHAHKFRDHGRALAGMVSLEMLGYCDHRPGSQMLPRSLVGQYPDTGDFIAIIGNQNSTRLLEEFRDAMREVGGLPVETLQVPENGLYLQATRLSDHSPFWDAGYPALMITDTSFLRNPFYHTPDDTLETLDLEFLAKVAEGCWRATQRILERGLSG